MSLFTDLYELTMCASYFDNKRNELATFDLFIRKLPPNRSYFVFAGLEQALFFLKNMRFNPEQIDYLRKQGFKEDFLNYLRNFKFSGEVWAIPEGTMVFPNEPVIRVTAPIIEAQLMESFLLNKEIYQVNDGDFKKTLDELVSLLEVEEVLNIQVRNLSLGQRMKCELIASLLHRPKVLFLEVISKLSSV